MSNTLSREACEAYKALGGPQDQWPQHVWLVEIEPWSDARFDGDVPYRMYAVNPPNPSCGWINWLACPDALDALDWIEREKGIMWERWPRLDLSRPPEWCAGRDTAEEQFTALADNPSALIIAIAAYVAQQEANRVPER